MNTRSSFRMAAVFLCLLAATEIVRAQGQEADTVMQADVSTTPPPLTRAIGQAERAMRALLEQQLTEVDLSFPEWTVLVFLDGAGPLTPGELVQRQVQGHIAGDTTTARAPIEALRSSALIAHVDRIDDAKGEDGAEGRARLSLTAEGEAVYRPLREAVSRITNELYGDMPAGDLEASYQTLMEIARRANARLADTR